MQTSSQHFKCLRQLEDDYYDLLDSRGIDYLRYDTYDQGYSQAHIREEFAIPHDQMASELGYESVKAYVTAQVQEEESTNLSLSIEHQVGRFFFSYDNDDLTIFDVKDNQTIVVSLSYDQETIKQMCLGICSTFIKYNAALGGVQ